MEDDNLHGGAAGRRPRRADDSKHTQFQKGVCPNPKGRGKGRGLKLDELMKEVLHSRIAFRENGRVKHASRLELAIRRLAAKAAKGDAASAASLLKLRAHAQKHGDAGPIVIRVAGGLFDLGEWLKEPWRSRIAGK